MYTSGTTGPSKGVLMPHCHCALLGLGAIRSLEITEADKYYHTTRPYEGRSVAIIKQGHWTQF